MVNRRLCINAKPVAPVSAIEPRQDKFVFVEHRAQLGSRNDLRSRLRKHGETSLRNRFTNEEDAQQLRFRFVIITV